MRILITGARAPVAVDWARIALRSGHDVIMADSLRFPLGRFLQGIDAYERLPAPKQQTQAYRDALRRVIEQQRINLIIPTCEEVFYLAQARDTLANGAHWLLPQTRLLQTLHHKQQSTELLRDFVDIHIPHTRLLTDIADIDYQSDTVLKPVYSRFGSQVIRSPQPACLNSRQLNANQPWVQQEKIHGEALCNYGLYQHGHLIAQQAYRPRYCLNQSAATYFQPCEHPALPRFMRQFGERFQYHGQVAFDFIERDGRLYFIECNPRATSGLHLLKNQLRLNSRGDLEYRKATTNAQRIGNTLPLLFGWQALKNGCFTQLLNDHKHADNALHANDLPLKIGSGFLPMAELCTKAVGLGLSLTEASTADIAWDGEGI